MLSYVNKFRLLVVLMGLVCCHAQAQTNQVDEFIDAVASKTYDCPADEGISTLEAYLASNDLTPSQRHRLITHKTHWQICQGKTQLAKQTLTELLNQGEVDGYAYRYALFQMGYILETHGQIGNCEYYQKAMKESEKAKDDVFLSAKLSLITECEDIDVSQTLGVLYNMVDEYSRLGDLALLAHVHHNIAVLYGNIGQYALAAEQYEKVYELGKSVYEKKNHIPPLTSMLTSYSGSGDFESMAVALERLREVNAEVNTPWSNVMLQLQLSRYHWRTRDLSKLKDSLKTWSVFLSEVDNPQLYEVYLWFSTYLCIYEQHRECVQAFVSSQQSKDVPLWIQNKKDYLDLMVRSQLFLGDTEAAQKAFDLYSSRLFEQIYQQQAAGKVLGVANLQSKIIALEDELNDAKWSRRISYFSVALVVTLLAIFTLFRLRRINGHVERDQVTQLLSRKAVCQQIENMSINPGSDVNVLALIKIDNLAAIRNKYGAAETDNILRSVANDLRVATRNGDILGRISDTHFFIALRKVEASFGSELVDRIQSAVESKHYETNIGDSVKFNISRTDFLCSEKITNGNQVLEELQGSLS